MSTTQFAMVEELASLVKDNYPSRHLVLAVEEALINFIKSDPSPDEILELEPMSSYNRLILHRLADIFGFSHESVGEEDDRHLVLQQCLETSIPSVLVSDILWEHDRSESSPVPYQILRREGACSVSVLKMNASHSTNFIDREAAYQAARERIFGVGEVELKDASRQKPKTNPVVARRMISHALGQRMNPYCQAKAENTRHHSEQSDVHDIERKFAVDLDLASETSPYSGNSLGKNFRLLGAKAPDTDCRPGRHTEKFSCKALNNGPVTPKKSMKEENFGAAKRMFAHALGIQSTKNDVSGPREVKGTAE